MTKELIDWVNLRKLYEFESSKVSGPGSYRRDINDALWTLEELGRTLSLSSNDMKDFEYLIEKLLKKKSIMKIRGLDCPDRYVTRTAEIVRLLGHNYEYWYRGRQSIDSVRWLIEDKKVPDRNIPVEDFTKALLDMVSLKIGDGSSTFNLKTAIEEVMQGVAAYFEPKDWKKAKFSKFQLESTREMILSQFKPGHQYKAQILTAGVGSGKTIAFTIGMLVSAVEGLKSGQAQHRRCHIFLYPRKALAQDQYTKLKDIVKNIQPLQVHFEHYSFYKKHEKKSVKEGIEQIYQGPSPPPDIIVMTLETLNRRLQHPMIIGKLAKYLKRVVLDEIHLVEGISGCQVIRLLARLRQACYPNEILWTGSSATVANPDLHAMTVFGLEQRNDVKVIEPSNENLITVGLVHHVFVRPSGRLSSLGTLVNSTSILTHNRRQYIWDRDANYPKTIGFADNLEILGRWNSEFRENERTEKASDRIHPNVENPSNWQKRQREIPYALRFNRPLERRINAVGGKPKSEEYEPVLQDFKNDRVCEKCKQGERIKLKTCDRKELQQLGRLVYREPHKEEDDVKIFHINNKNVFETDSMEIGTLDLCPYLKSGTCFWFAQDDFKSELIEGFSYEWRSIARSRIHSSKTSQIKPNQTKSDSELDDDLSDLVFSATIEEVYDFPKSEQVIPIDVVLASPSLEVGIDLPNVTESVMFKAIRSVASYRQKVGRIGREMDSDVMNVNLLSLRPIDLHYYRQPRKLTSIARLDPIPLKEHNDSILRCALYMAVWDCLSLNSNLPEVIPLGGLFENETQFTQRLKISRNYLNENRANIAWYLSGIARLRFKASDSIIQEAINQVADEIDVFLTTTKGTIENECISHVSDIVAHSLSPYGAKLHTVKQTKSLDRVRIGEDEYKLYRPGINPVLFNLSKEFQDLDCFNESGWVDISRLKEIHQRIGDLIKNQSNDEEMEDLEALKDLNSIALRHIIEGLEGMEKLGQNPLVIYFLEQFNSFRTKRPYWPYYLSYTLQGMPIFNALRTRRHRDYTRPPNLFTNPYEETVTLIGKHGIEDNVKISEALFGFIPGTWSFRQGKVPKKILCGKLRPSRGGVLTASLETMESVGNDFDKIQTNVPTPPGFSGNLLDIYMPRKIALNDVNRKYVGLNPGPRTVFDWDEDSAKESKEAVSADIMDEASVNNKHPMVKIPSSFPNRWVHIIPDKGTRILVNDLNENNLVIEEEKVLKGYDARVRIFHPMLKQIVDSISWHDHLEVYDYVFSVSRIYSSKIVNNATLMFQTNKQKDIAFGRFYETEGVSITLNPSTVKAAFSRIKEEMLLHKDKWVPSIMKAFMALLCSKRLPDGTPVSPFMVDNLVGVLITTIPLDFDSRAIYELPEKMASLLADESKFREIAEKYYRGKYLIDLDEEGPWISESSTQDMQDLKTAVENLVGFAMQLKDEIPDVKSNLENWITRTLLNTFGVAALSALQRLCGSEEDIIGYTIDLEGINKGEYRIFLYDRTHYGNGSSDVLKKYLYILNIQRHGQTDESRLLPSEDYLTLLEQELLQCPQFHTDMDALEKLTQKQKGQQVIGLPELAFVGEQSDEVLRVCEDTWKQLGIRGRADAWKLPIISLAPGSFAHLRGIEVDDVIRATNVCWNGCPECVIGAEGKTFIDKAILDEWFKLAREGVNEYKTVSIEDIAVGKSRVEIGMQSKVCLELPNRKIRSISLPFTIGFELERDQVPPHARLLIRDDDIQGFRAFEESQKSAHGIESSGFKRIMWYNLMTSAYLDILGLLGKERKEIALVFYDCRDVSFDDVGISPRMIQVIEYHCKKVGMRGEINRLSDILVWLARQGFRLSLCVDQTQCQEESVRGFLAKLSEIEMSNISIMVKGLQGSMHKKAMITPVGVIQGSANLTYSGTGLNEEIINYAPYGVREYEEMKLSILDTFHGSEKWRQTN
ncbi:MAG: DEAD/DEAH box helicase [Nitrososphaeria archaeon]